MFARLTICAADLAASRLFYETVLPPIGISPAACSELALRQADADDPVTRGLHIGFIAPSRDHVDAFHLAGVEAGHPDDGAPGPRQYTPDFYGAFLLDPDGNSVEACHYSTMRGEGCIDHLWVRVADVALTHESHANNPRPGHNIELLSPDHLIVRTGDGWSMSFVSGEPSQNVDVEFA